MVVRKAVEALVVAARVAVASKAGAWAVGEGVAVVGVAEEAACAVEAVEGVALERAQLGAVEVLGVVEVLRGLAVAVVEAVVARWAEAVATMVVAWAVAAAKLGEVDSEMATLGAGMMEAAATVAEAKAMVAPETAMEVDDQGWETEAGAAAEPVKAAATEASRAQDTVVAARVGSAAAWAACRAVVAELQAAGAGEGAMVEACGVARLAAGRAAAVAPVDLMAVARVGVLAVSMVVGSMAAVSVVMAAMATVLMEMAAGVAAACAAEA